MAIQSSMVQGSVSSTVNAVHIWPSPDAARQKTYREHLGIHQTDGQLATFSRLLAPSWLSGSKLVAAGQPWLRAVTQRTDRTALRPAEGLASQSTQHDHYSMLYQNKLLKSLQNQSSHVPPLPGIFQPHVLTKKLLQQKVCLLKLTTREVSHQPTPTLTLPKDCDGFGKAFLPPCQVHRGELMPVGCRACSWSPVWIHTDLIPPKNHFHLTIVSSLYEKVCGLRAFANTSLPCSEVEHQGFQD